MSHGSSHSVETYTRRAIMAFRGQAPSPQPHTAVEIYKDPLAQPDSALKTKDLV